MPVAVGKWVRSACLLVLILGISSASFGADDDATITGGFVNLSWDGFSAVTLLNPTTKITADIKQLPKPSLTVGETADLSADVASRSCGQVPPVVVNGNTYSSPCVGISLALRADPFVVPAFTTSALNRLATRYTMTGVVSGYSDSTSTTPTFSITLHGAGVVEFFWNTFQGNSYLAISGGGQRFTFTGDEAGWTGTDIGSVGLPGNDGLAFDGTSTWVEIGGAGGDIWGGADAFHFRYFTTPLTGDGSITVQLTNQQNTNIFAKAGIMLRRSLAANSAHITLDIKPDTGIELLTRAQDGGDTSFLGGSGPGLGGTLRLSRTGNQVTAAVSPGGSGWTVVGTATLTGPVYLGLAVTSHDVAVVNQAQFANVAVSTENTGVLPAPWTIADIGDVGQAGRATGSGGNFDVVAAGADIWGAADSFSYVYQPFTGDGSITATIRSLQNTSPFAKAGVMIRASTAPGAANVILDVKPDGGIEFMVRSTDGTSTQFISGTFATLPVNLQLVRQGSTITAIAGSFKQTIEVQLPDSALFGLAVTSHDPSTLNTAMFSDVAAIHNLVVNGGFEASTPPLTTPGWISDTPFRQLDAVTDVTQPRTGLKHGECVTQTGQDCGLYQDITIPESGNYVLTAWTNSDTVGAYVGINVTPHGSGAPSVISAPVNVGGPNNYSRFTTPVVLEAGDVVRVWVYAPASPGTTVIDDVELIRQ
jgi:hypothetical protein